jgi:PKD repeat protein
VAVSVPPASAPTLTVPVYNGSGSYTVSWSAVKEALSYTLQQQTNGGAWATIQNSSALSIVISGNAYATYGYQVQACDVGGCSAWSPVGTISVASSPLMPSFTYILNGLGVKFTDTSTDSAGTITTHHWVFGDGGSSTAVNPSHLFLGAGPRTVSETVTDNVGNTQTYIATVTVR